MLKASVFAQFAEPQHEFFLILTEPGDAQAPAAPYIPVSRWRRGDEPRMRRAAIRDVAWPCCEVSAEQVAGSRIPIGERSSTCRCERPRPATALAYPHRHHGMPPAHECSGGRHYPCGSRFANEDRRRRENAGLGTFAAPIADKRRRSAPLKNANGCQGPAVPPDSAAHPLRMRLVATRGMGR